MARAKQTNRAEARRRHRLAVAQSTADAEQTADADEEPGATAATSARKAAASTTQARPGIGAAFREAYRPAHYREDLAALPGLLTLRQPTRIPLTRTVIGVPWFIVSAVLVIVGFAAYAVYPAEGTVFLFQLLALPPGGPTMPVLLVGFMASRASYMQGFLIGLLDLALIAVYASVIPTTTGAGTSIANLVSTAAITGLPTSVLFAGAAAWYRRFLALSSPRRQQQGRGASRGKGGGRPANRR